MKLEVVVINPFRDEISERFFGPAHDDFVDGGISHHKHVPGMLAGDLKEVFGVAFNDVEAGLEGPMF